MSDFTHYTEGQIADWMVMGTDVASAHGSVFVALHTDDPGQSPDGSTEVGAASYSRYESTAGTDWTEVQSGAPTEVENANDFEFSQAQENWGSISHVSLWTAASGGGGNCIASFALDSTKTIESGDTARFQAGDLSFLID